MSPRRSALLVATYRYQDAKLSQLIAPAHDAEALADVLSDSEIANFDVTVLVNEPHHVVLQALGDFYANRRREDITLLYFTGHGLKDEQGRLYLAMTNTIHDRLLYTGLPAQQIDEAMESCVSRRKILVLDCCYSGAFPAGHIPKTGVQANTIERFQGRGRVVLTASDSVQYAFQGDSVTGEASQSVFTRFLVEGLTTGEADLDDDGEIDIDELYGYVHDRMADEMPHQRPQKQENIEGRIVVAKNIHWSLPSYICDAVQSPFVQERLAGLDRLGQLCRMENTRVRAEAINQIRLLTDDDSKRVSDAAKKLIAELNPEARPKVGHARSAGGVLGGNNADFPEDISVANTAKPKSRVNLCGPKPWIVHELRQLMPTLRRRPIAIATGALLVLLGIVIFITFGRSPSGPDVGSTPMSSAAPTEIPQPTVAATLQVGKTPAFVTVSPNGRQAYIANRDAQIITVLDTETRRTIGIVPNLTGPPQHLALSPDGRRLYVAIYNDEKIIHEIDVVDTGSNSVIATIPQPARPFVPVVTPDGKRLFVPEHDIAAVLVIDTSTNSVITQVAVPPRPHWVVFSPDGKRAYAANHESSMVSVIDTGTLTVLKTIPVDMSPHSVAINSRYSLVASANYDANSVSEINTNTLDVVRSISVGKNPRDIKWAPDGRFGYVANEGSNTVSVIDAATSQITASIPTGDDPTSIAVLPDGRQAYVSNLNSGTLTVLQLTT